MTCLELFDGWWPLFMMIIVDDGWWLVFPMANNRLADGWQYLTVVVRDIRGIRTDKKRNYFHGIRNLAVLVPTWLANLGHRILDVGHAGPDSWPFHQRNSPKTGYPISPSFDMIMFVCWGVIPMARNPCWIPKGDQGRGVFLIDYYPPRMQRPTGGYVLWPYGDFSKLGIPKMDGWLLKMIDIDDCSGYSHFKKPSSGDGSIFTNLLGSNSHPNTSTTLIRCEQPRVRPGPLTHSPERVNCSVGHSDEHHIWEPICSAAPVMARMILVGPWEICW